MFGSLRKRLANIEDALDRFAPFSALKVCDLETRLETLENTPSVIEKLDAELQERISSMDDELERVKREHNRACTPYDALLRRIEAIEKGTAPGVLTRLADLADENAELKAGLDRAGEYLILLAALSDKKLAMSERVPAQPSRPVLVELRKTAKK